MFKRIHAPRARKWWPFVALAPAVVLAFLVRPRSGRQSVPSPAAAPVDARYATTIQPLFDRRCVPCHACFDSPCQLNLQSFEGLDRGANKELVYHPDRLEAMHPTRMFEDARTSAEWRLNFDFFPVVQRSEPADVARSILWRFVEQRRAYPGGGPFDVDATTSCPRDVSEVGRELHDRPDVGMPFGFPPLGDDEAHAIRDWLREGSGGAATPGETAEQTAAIAASEAFLNAADPKSRIVARYVFEHLAFAHLQLDDTPGTWFRVVRSRTPSPEPIDPIATVRPFDDPGVPRVWYRLRRVRETIVEKTHVPYRLSAEKLAHLRHLFLDADWGAASTAFPSYAPEVAANPFVAFAAIPARARYQFLLDDALYHVKTFIHGPVCKGQVALDVIDEHFFIFFAAPDRDPSITDPAYLPATMQDLAIPAEGGDGIEAVYERFKLHETAYLRAQGEKLLAAPGRTLEDIWNGEGTNGDAVLTVYRHFDSAFVVDGAVGGVPKTAWVLDYPIFERMYYDLVAGFDVFGNFVHQVSTRRYMNLLRIESENQFLRFLPVSRREAIRASWYRGAGVATLVAVFDPLYGGPDPRIRYNDPANAKDELVKSLVTRALPAGAPGTLDSIQWTDLPIEGDDPRARFERAAREIVAKRAPYVRPFPDAALLRVRVASGEDLVYTIIRNRSHANIDFMFLEKDFLLPEEDTLHVVRGITVSRPNLLLGVAEADLGRFFADWRGLLANGSNWREFVDRYGVRRADPGFWRAFDFFGDAFSKIDPAVAGVLDLSRYGND
jgi:hypothetical protein